MSERDLRAVLEAEGLIPSAWSNGPDERYGAHRHGYDKVLVPAAGSITFELPEEETSVEMAVGDRLDLPAGTLHSARVGRDGTTCLEAHLPPGSLAGPASHRVGWADGLSATRSAETGRLREA